MGWIRHRAIVVTTLDSMMPDVHKKAMELCPGLVSPVIQGVVNGFCSFFVAPDGSKEGWADSDEWDDHRSSLIKELESMAYEDGSTSVKWALVQFGDDEGDNRVLRASR